MMSFKRELDLAKIKGTAFLFGPRMTGKTSLLEEIDSDYNLNLLEAENEFKYRANPELFLKEILVLKKGARVIVDEIQRVPALLDYVQIGIQKYNLNFFLSGSSARKLKRGSANLLGGRAADLRLHPLTAEELGKHFQLDQVLKYGALPKISTLAIEKNELERDLLLKSYVTTYLKEEIQVEALVRKLDSFQRFLPVAAQANAQVIEFTNISRECAVHMNTVKDYYSILEDTMIGSFLWPWDRSERKKARPKFYFFDTGVVRAIQGLIGSVPSNHDYGFLFETWFVNEIKKINDYNFKNYELSFWRKGNLEIDLIVMEGGKPVIAFELKYGKNPDNLANIRTFQQLFPKIPIFIVSAKAEKPQLLGDKIKLFPWKQALSFYKEKF